MKNQSSVVGRRSSAILIAFILFSLLLPAQTSKGKAEPVHVFGPNLVTLPSSSSLYQIQIMVRTGSADDPVGKEGTASLVARALIEGGFGDPKNPITKEKLADTTRPWGDAATPRSWWTNRRRPFRSLFPVTPTPSSSRGC